MTKKSDIWMAWYVAEYLADTMHLTTEQHGAYVLLIMAAWKNGGELLDDDSELQAICRLTSKAWKQHRATLGRFFNIADGKWTHKRVVIEHKKAQELSAKRRNSGANGAAKRWKTDSKPIANAMANAIANGSQTDRHSHSHISITDVTEIKRDAPQAVECPVGVDGGLWAEWKAHRKKKRAVVSANVVNSCIAEAEKLGWTLSQAFRKSIDRGWTGFEAEWVKRDTATSGGTARATVAAPVKNYNERVSEDGRIV